MNSDTKEMIKYSAIFLINGIIYYLLECVFRGYSSVWMVLIAGLIGIFAMIQNNRTEWEVPLWKQMLRVALFAVSTEFVSGFIFNILMGLNLWDYSNVPLNIMGQICLPFALLWIPLSLIAIVLDDYIEYWFFNGEKPRYKIIGGK